MKRSQAQRGRTCEHGHGAPSSTPAPPRRLQNWRFARSLGVRIIGPWRCTCTRRDERLSLREAGVAAATGIPSDSAADNIHVVNNISRQLECIAFYSMRRQDMNHVLCMPDDRDKVALRRAWQRRVPFTKQHGRPNSPQTESVDVDTLSSSTVFYVIRTTDEPCWYPVRRAASGDE